MASNIYVRSGAGGTASGADWANACLTLTAGFTASAAGDAVWVAEDHAETTSAGALTLTTKGTAAAPCTILCVNHSGSVPPVSADLATTATITTTTQKDITIAGGVGYWYGIQFYAGTGSSQTHLNIGSAANNTIACHRFLNCIFNVPTTATFSSIAIGGTTNNAQTTNIILEACKFGLQSTSAGIALNRFGIFQWLNTTTPLTTGGSYVNPTILFNPTNSVGAVTHGPSVFEGVDLSGFSGTIAGAQGFGEVYYLNNCKLNASVTVSARQTAPGGRAYIAISDSTSHNYNQAIYGDYTGDLTTETTITRVGGASDGAQLISWKLVTTANANYLFPFECFTDMIWNPTVGSSVTATLHFGSATGSLTNKDIWFDVEYMSATTSPIGSQATTGVADVLATGTSLTADVTSTWNSAPANLYQAGIAFTPQMAGPIRIRVRVAKPSLTIYVDPLIVLS